MATSVGGRSRQVISVLSTFAVVAGLGVMALAGPVDAAPRRVTAHVANGTLYVTGTSRADHIEISIYSGNLLKVTIGVVDRAELTFGRNRFTAIRVSGGAGNDYLHISGVGGAFTDTEETTLAGGRGNDRLLGGPYAEGFIGGLGDDYVDGNTGNDRVRLGPGADLVRWTLDDGRDKIRAGAGRDTVEVVGSNLADTIAIGPGVHRAYVLLRGGPLMKDMEIAEVYGKRGNDTISGPFLGLRLTSLRIFGGPGSDDLHGAGGRDLLLGGPGEDVLNGGRAADRVFGGPAGDTIADRDSSDDALYGGNLLSSEGCSAVHGIDTITSQGPGADRVFGGNLNGRVVCHDGPDVLSVADGTAGDTVVGDNRGSGGVAADTIAADPGDKIFRNNDLRR